jgi:hypothetical protein
MENERGPILSEGKKKADRGCRKEEGKTTYINRGEMSPFVFVPLQDLAPHYSLSPWFVSCQPIFSNIFKRKVASLL